MKTVFFDINIVLDIFLKREPFYAASAQVFSLAETKQLDGRLGVLSYPILFYLLKKRTGVGRSDCNFEKGPPRAENRVAVGESR